MVQSKTELEDWYNKPDPWRYEDDPEDVKRKQILLQSIPEMIFNNTLDIGCGNGFITQSLPGKQVIGTDISENAVIHAAEANTLSHVTYQQSSIFDMDKLGQKFDLVVITGVLYPQYIGASFNFIYMVMDKVLTDDGILISVHIDSWYKCRFPYNLISERIYPYKEYLHRLEVYQK